MKSTGIVRKVDELGRVVLPMELRRTLGIEEKDPIEVFVDGDKIILRKYHPGCLFCGSTDQLRGLASKQVCSPCIKTLALARA
ncbi:AbrB family transcriptional regulator [Paenibacillus sp. J31TS4]|uniref:AbrB/MazE/SpoVT family DNA-binding domain-containing protein n=1 Tax=Paenibacillus sp. J31TS4 TaxID=2807195 RepID=UPI001B25CF33|nr:AbrB/MazE/SpoVT family DNA-binding domain-containing protein [Paenibacillus sp. J31TS4]GIP38333.1 AbrB family transcriptional regulator [Paenibacillus sp. J31TS4]